MTSLKDLQDSFQSAVLGGDDAILDSIPDSPREKRDVLLGVYRNAYVLRLADILAGEYEQLFALLGDEQFGEMARKYIAANTSLTPNARWFGAHLPEFLTLCEDFADEPVVADLAAIEKLLNDVFDALDDDALTQQELAAVDPQDWASLVFSPISSSRRLDLGTNALDIWQALKAEETPPDPVIMEDTVHVISWRPETTCKYRTLEHEEAMMWDEMAKGSTFGDLCSLVAFSGGEDDAPIRAAGYLQSWISAGMLGAGKD